jgi:hypothetical protein
MILTTLEDMKIGFRINHSTKQMIENNLAPGKT